MSLEELVGGSGVENVLSINTDETINIAIYRMLHNNFRRLPVLDDNYEIAGIITVSDILKAAHHLGHTKYFENAVEQYMSKDLISVDPYTPIKDAILKLFEAGISGMPIVQDETILVGMFSQQDIINNQNVWDELPNIMIGIEYGIGKILQDDEIATFDYSIWQAIDLMSKFNDRELIVNYDNAFQVITTFDFLKGFLGKLMMELPPLSFIHSTPVSEFSMRNIITLDAPIYIDEIVSIFQEKNIHTLLLRNKENKLKLVREKDLMGYVSENLRLQTDGIMS